MNFIQILDIILIVVLILAGIEFMVKLNKNRDKQIEKIRKVLIIRLNIIMFLTIAIGIVTVANVIFKTIQ